MALVLGVSHGDRIVLVTRCGDVVELAFRYADAHSAFKAAISGTPRVRVWRGGQARAPEKPEAIEDRLGRVLGARQVELVGVDFVDQVYQVEAAGRAELVRFADAWPCAIAGAPCDKGCWPGSCWRARRGGKGAK